MGMKPRAEPAARGNEVQEALRQFARSLPGAHEDFPWGEVVAKVGKKVFAFFGSGAEAGCGVKLPQSGEAILALPFAQPSGYGLGKHGWVDIRGAPGEIPPVELLCELIEESYRAVAPRRLVAELDREGRPEKFK